MSIAQNLERLRNEVADACARAHRAPGTVALMAVSKTNPAEAILEAHAAGQRLFGENRVQEFASKSPALAAILSPPPLPIPYSLLPTGVPGGRSLPAGVATPCSFHLIGPLQNNKTTPAAELFDAIDTLDSLKTADRLNTTAKTLNKQLSILIEIKLSPEDSKHGLAPEDLPALLASLAPLSNLTISGLMTVPPFTEDPELARPYFQHLRRLRDENLPTYPNLTELSMGMSHDFQIAIEEGSTTIRLGTAIFGKRTYP
jgi:pyridoxal phosphate enzyme (YggS family)